jgi:hypothetical protein
LKWKADAEECEREQHAQQRTGSVALLHAEVESLRSELQQLRDEMDARRENDIKNLADVANSVADVIDRLPDWIDTVAKKSHGELRALIAERFGELIGLIRALDGSEARAARGEPFKFASEKANKSCDVVELPNPLPSRRVIN